MSTPQAAGDVEVRVATPERWDDLRDLFTRLGPRGGRPMTDGCWCMYWRQRTGSRARNREAFAALVESGSEPGLLAYRDAVPVGWVAVAPREELGQLLRSPTYRPADADPGVFSVTCLYVQPTAKRSGVATALLAAAAEHARRRGGRWVEAYASEDPRDYMGWRPTFERLGYTAVRTAGKRTIMRLALDRSPHTG